jgi:hypothetical protein
MRRIRIPADVDREDQLLAGLSARQLAVVAVACVLCWLVYLATHSLLSPAAIVILCAPIVVVSTALVVGRIDGLHGDRLAVAVGRHVTSPWRHVLAPEGVVDITGATQGVVPLRLSPQSFGRDGVVDCGPDGNVLVCAASSVAFRLRTEAEQEALMATFGRFLNGLTGPVQILVHVERVNLAASAQQLDDAATALPHPSLQCAAREHATFLRTLSARPDVLRRDVLVIFREAASSNNIHPHATEASDTLSAVGIRVQPLNGIDAAALIRSTADRSGDCRVEGLSAPDDIIHGGRA